MYLRHATDDIDMDSRQQLGMTVVYILIDPFTDDVRYVGKTIQSLKSRLSAHIRDRSQGYKSRWIRSVVAAGGIPLILPMEVVANAAASDRERHWIGKFSRLTNLTDGGEGTIGWIPDAEWRQRMSALKKGKPWPKSRAWRLKMSARMRGNSYGRMCAHTDETKKRIADAKRMWWTKRRRGQ